jgi:lipoprotein-anchoring transpeptidase ErfK/SrfK
MATAPACAKVALVCALTAATIAVQSSAARAAPAVTVAPAQLLATLQTPHAVFSTVRTRRPRRGTLPARRPVTGGRTVVPVVDAVTEAGVIWLRVMLPGRPNGSLGWIEQRGTVLTSTPWHLVVSTSGRRVAAYRDGRVVRSFTAIVGKPSTPTPTGEFFVEESVAMRPGSAGAPFALALSARSNVLQEFEGGPGQTAIHGTRNLPGALGTAASHGCVRLSDRAIAWLAARIAPGVPVTVTR